MEPLPLFAVSVMLFALVIAWIHWRQVKIVTPFIGFVIVSILNVNIGFLYMYFLNYGEVFAFNALLATTLGLLFTVLGWVFFALLAGLNLGDCRVPPHRIRLHFGFIHYVGTAALVALLLGGFIYLRGGIPLIEALITLATEGLVPGLLSIPRNSQDVYINPEAKYIPFQGLFEILRYSGSIVITLWFIHIYRINKNKNIKILSSIFIFLFIFLLIARGQRWPLLHFLIALMIYFSINMEFIKLKKAIIYTLLVGLLIGVLLTTLLMRTVISIETFSQFWGYGFVKLTERFFIGNTLIPFTSYDVFPARKPYLLGDSFVQNLASLLPGARPSFPVTFYQMVSGDSIGYTAPPDLYTEFYINFGWAGIIVGCFVWGCILAISSKLFLHLFKNIFSLSFYCIFVLYISMSSVNGLHMINSAFIVFFIFYSIIKLLKLITDSTKNFV